jgi:Reverse transcriptase (RNA-dependent DNA polymerase)
VLTNGLCNISRLEVHDDLSSDHCPVTFSIGASNIEFITENRIPCYNRADWILFKNFLNNSIQLNNITPNLLQPSDIDSMVEFISIKIQEAVDLAVPKVNPFVFQYILPESIRALIRFRNARRRQWQRHRDPYLGRIVSFLNQQIRVNIQKFRNNEWATLLSTIRTTDNQFWKTTKILKRRQNIIPTLKDNGRKKFSDQEKSNLIAQKFSEAHLLTLNQPVPVTVSNRVTEKIQEIHTSPPVDVEASELTSPREIKSIIKNLGRRKTPGLDRINNVALKNLPRKALVFLTYLFNACIFAQYFPKNWKHATVVAIPKPGKDHSDSKSYRPISLLCGLSKVFERIILQRISNHITDNNVLPNFQFGFRPQHSTCHQVVRITNHIKQGFREKLSTGMFLLDIEKAFDTVWHDGLLFKMSIKELSHLPNKTYPIFSIRPNFLCRL